MHTQIGSKLNWLLVFTVFFFGFQTTFGQEKTEVVPEKEPITIEKLVAKKIAFNQSENVLNRYTVQLYSGNYEEAQKQLEKFGTLFPDYKAVIKFQTPNYKVWIPNFRNKLEAETLFEAAKPEFPSILIFRIK
ncbi:MAG: hypothetical protein RQ735_09770 [Flavobacteriaceae bacterium]|nr:hypothetical protein [Flavobacteriaceae bacterium]